MFKISSGDSQGKMSKDQIKEQRHSKKKEKEKKTTKNEEDGILKE